MRLDPQTPKKVLKPFLKQKPLRSEIDIFKTNLIALLDKITLIENRPKVQKPVKLTTENRFKLTTQFRFKLTT